MAVIIDGKAVSDRIKSEIALENKKLMDDIGVMPGLAVIIVGNDSASKIYVSNKIKACEKVGFYSEKIQLSEKISQKELVARIEELNNRVDIDGILVQLPLPKHISEKVVLGKIDPRKDVDCFSPFNVGRITINDYRFLPCTPAGVMELLKETGVELAGKNCVVIGRSNIVGKPMAMMLINESATVTVCHSKTVNLPEITSKADILISAVGKPKFVTADMVKDGAIVIDVGINHDENGKLCGDVDFNAVEPKAGYITPVPGGVGPMTIAMLMKNTIMAAKANAILNVKSAGKTKAAKSKSDK